eukprot:6178857-Pleurochrysis_carterae.AAC.2
MSACVRVRGRIQAPAAVLAPRATKYTRRRWPRNRQHGVTPGAQAEAQTQATYESERWEGAREMLRTIYCMHSAFCVPSDTISQLTVNGLAT